MSPLTDIVLATDFDVAPWSAWAGLGASVAVIITALCGAVWFIVRQQNAKFTATKNAIDKLDGRLDAQDTAIAVQGATVATIKAEQSRQFGGNSGGIREALNGVVATTSRIERRLDDHLEFHARPQ